jgi:hypothetical protein
MSWRSLGGVAGCIGVLAFSNALAETYVGSNNDRAVLLHLEPRGVGLVDGWIESIGFNGEGQLELAEGSIAGSARVGGEKLFVGPAMYTPMPLLLSLRVCPET